MGAERGKKERRRGGRRTEGRREREEEEKGGTEGKEGKGGRERKRREQGRGERDGRREGFQYAICHKSNLIILINCTFSQYVYSEPVALPIFSKKCNAKTSGGGSNTA